MNVEMCGWKRGITSATAPYVTETLTISLRQAPFAISGSSHRQPPSSAPLHLLALSPPSPPRLLRCYSSTQSTRNLCLTSPAFFSFSSPFSSSFSELFTSFHTDFYQIRFRGTCVGVEAGVGDESWRPKLRRERSVIEVTNCGEGR